jgi:hypothetical protein
MTLFRQRGTPEKSQCEACETNREVIIKKAHVKDVAISKHGDCGRKKPWSLMRNCTDKGKGSPKENQYAARDGDFLRERKSKQVSEFPERQVKKNIVPLRREIQAGRLAPFDELREPGIIGVTGKVAGCDMPMPNAGKNQRGRNCADAQPEIPDKEESR